MSIVHYEHPQASDPVSAADLATKNYVDLAANDRTYGCRAWRTAAFTFSATAGTAANPFLWDTVAWGSGYATGTGLYTCPVAGLYLARASMSVGMTVAGTVTVGLNQNGASNAVTNTYQGVGVQATVVHIATVMNCAVNDTISAYASTSQASGAFRTGAAEAHFLVIRLGVL